MRSSKTEDTLCIICDFWWAILLGLAVILAALLTNGFGLLPPPPTPTPPPPTPAPLPTAAPTQKLGTGDVQITLRWNNLNDLDLHVFDPNNEEIFYSHPQSQTKGVLDVDSNAGCSQNLNTSPVENVYWPQGQAPAGNYRIAVQYYALCPNQSASTSFQVRLLINGVEKTFTGQVATKDEVVTVNSFTFTR